MHVADFALHRQQIIFCASLSSVQRVLCNSAPSLTFVLGPQGGRQSLTISSGMKVVGDFFKKADPWSQSHRHKMAKGLQSERRQTLSHGVICAVQPPRSVFCVSQSSHLDSGLPRMGGVLCPGPELPSPFYQYLAALCLVQVSTLWGERQPPV